MRGPVAFPSPLGHRPGLWDPSCMCACVCVYLSKHPPPQDTSSLSALPICAMGAVTASRGG